MIKFTCMLFSLTTVVVLGQQRTPPVSSRSAWGSKKADVYFLLDATSSVWVQDYLRQRQFVADLISELDLTQTRVGVGVYSNTHQVWVPLNASLSKTSIINKTLDAPYLTGDSHLASALKDLREILSSANRRPQVPAIGVIFADGDTSNRFYLASEYAELAKMEGIFLFCVGVGDEERYRQFQSYASDPKSDFLFSVPDFYALKNIKTKFLTNFAKVDYLPIGEEKCVGKFLDTVFVYDKSAMGDKGSKDVKLFLKEFIAGVSVNSGKVRVGVVSKTCQKGDITLVQNLQRETLAKSLELDNSPDLTDLVTQALESSFRFDNGGRSYAEKRLVIFVHGHINNLNKIYPRLARTKYIQDEVYKIYIIRVGTESDKSYKELLESMATSKNHVFYVDASKNTTSNARLFLSDIFCKDI